MATQADVRRIAMSLPAVQEGDGDFSFGVVSNGKSKGIVWSWKERLEPKKARVESSTVVGIRVDGEAGKQMLIDADPDKFFTEPHYNGFPAILVRLPAIGVDELRELVLDAWRIQAPKTLVKAWLSGD